MSVVVVTGSGGLIGAEAVRFFCRKGFDVAGVDNDMRQTFFGDTASTAWSVRELEAEFDEYVHFPYDIRDRKAIESLFSDFGTEIVAVIHAAAQPSHDWAAMDPHTDFSINAQGTLNLLEATRQFAENACFMFLSTNKVYGDTPNRLPLIELETRWEVSAEHEFAEFGIDESMSVDQTRHSLFGSSKLAADSLVQEYGRYFGMKTGCFRGGCLTGPGHSGAELHGFLSYLLKCLLIGKPYTIFGYKGKQVRDHIHSFDLVNMLWSFFQNPRSGEVYNVGGSRHSNASILEVIDLAEQMTGKSLSYKMSDQARIGDHIWYVSDIRKFQADFPEWSFRYDLPEIMQETIDSLARRNEDRKASRH